MLMNIFIQKTYKCSVLDVKYKNIYKNKFMRKYHHNIPKDEN